APVVAALDLHDIVLGGPADLLGGPFLQASQELIIDRTHSEFRRNPSMRLSALGNEAVLLGAVSLVLRTTLGVS
ncbi:MAG: ROK family transcriptional regulator, partial [Propionibacteriaceae bacterium]|nr:ROK family transcriptional regulator [Propionibacteriaceae bacterium]